MKLANDYIKVFFLRFYSFQPWARSRLERAHVAIRKRI